MESENFEISIWRKQMSRPGCKAASLIFPTRKEEENNNQLTVTAHPGKERAETAS
jgi:hypothetical protein